jgi:nitrate/nitrite transporter NarK
LINCVGNLSGFVGPGLMGWLLQTTGSYTLGMWMCAAVALAAGLSMAALARSCRSR